MVESVLRKLAVRYEQAHLGLLYTRVLKVKDENSLDPAVRRIDVLMRLPFYIFTRLALRDLAS